jgi:hypothetical protein
LNSECGVLNAELKNKVGSKGEGVGVGFSIQNSALRILIEI